MVFRGEYYFLSNMYPARVMVTLNGRRYCFGNAEAAFQAGKCPEKAAEFENLDGFAAKRHGRKVPLIPSWDTEKLKWMHTVLAAKFAQDMGLRDKLLATGDMELVEDNTWNDRYWGRCDGMGENHLGKLLMQVRDEIRQSCREYELRG